MSPVSRLLLSAVLPLALPAAVMAQSPTLPSDTLEANYAPRSVPGPLPELAPSLPSDTLELNQPSSPSDSMRRDWDQEEVGREESGVEG
ncbi:MAG TPA: hypothetical protein VMN37_11210 [Gemmatimonadales bacterium]|nr:hypothetical protein [Gemmatimonadales bacterium]